jgi:hypothetical protein
MTCHANQLRTSLEQAENDVREPAKSPSFAYVALKRADHCLPSGVA